MMLIRWLHPATINYRRLLLVRDTFHSLKHILALAQSRRATAWSGVAELSCTFFGATFDNYRVLTESIMST